MKNRLKAHTSAESLNYIVNSLAENIGLNVLCSSTSDLIQKAIASEKVTSLVNDPSFNYLRSASGLNNLHLERNFVDLEPRFSDSVYFPDFNEEISTLSSEMAEEAIAERLIKYSFFVVISCDKDLSVAADTIQLIEDVVSRTIGLTDSTSSALRLSQAIHPASSLTKEPLVPFSGSNDYTGGVGVIMGEIVELDWGDQPCFKSCEDKLQEASLALVQKTGVRIHALKEDVFTAKLESNRVENGLISSDSSVNTPINYCSESDSFLSLDGQVAPIRWVGANSLLTESELNQEIELILNVINK